MSRAKKGRASVRHEDGMIMDSDHDLPPGRVLFDVFRTVLKVLSERRLAFTPHALNVCVSLSEALVTSHRKKVPMHLQVLAADRAMRKSAAGDDFQEIVRSAVYDLRGVKTAVMEEATGKFGQRVPASALEACVGVSKALLAVPQGENEDVQVLAANRAIQEGAGTDFRKIVRIAATDLGRVSHVTVAPPSRRKASSVRATKRPSWANSALPSRR
jgi:hypothetical protein